MSDEEDPPQGIATTSKVRQVKRKRKEVNESEENENVINISSDAEDGDEEILEATPPPRSRGGRKPSNSRIRKVEVKPDVMGVDSGPEEDIHISDSDEDGSWMYSHRPRPRRRRRTESPATMADLSDF